MNLAQNYVLEYEHNEDKLKVVNTFIQHLKTQVIVIEGRAGSGKSKIIEALVKDDKNIFRGCGEKTHIGPFVFTPSDSKYVAIDDTEYFETNQVLDFLKLAESEGKTAIVSSQGLEYFPVALKNVFKPKDFCKAENISIVTLQTSFKNE